MNIIFVLALTIFIEKSCSQMLSKSQDCFSDGDILTLNCETTALNDTISFNLNAGNEGGCVPGLGCGGNITQAGTTTSLTIYPYNDAAHGGSWSCTFGLLTSPVLIIAKNPCPISQMSTSIATERTTSVNSIFEFRNISIPMITDSLTLMSDISASTTSYINTGTTNFYAHTESTNFYTKTETTNLNANIETKNVDVNTEINEIQTKTLGIISNSMPIYQSMFVTTVANYISGSFDTTSQIMTETFALPGYSISSYNEITLPSTFEISNVYPQTFSVTLIPFSVDTLSDNLFHNFHVSSGSLIKTDASKSSILSITISPSYVGDSYIASISTFFSVPSLPSDKTDSAFEITNESLVNSFSFIIETIQTHITTVSVESSALNTVLNSKKSESLLLSISGNNSRIQQKIINTESLLMPTTFIDQISFSSNMKDPSFSSYQYVSETTLTLRKISVSSQLASAIIGTMNPFLYTTNTLITSYLDDTMHSFDDVTDIFQTFLQDYAASASTSLAIFSQLTGHHLSLQTTEYYETMQIKFTSYVTTPLHESHTDNTATGIYSKEIVTSGKSYMYTSVVPSQTQLASMNDIQDSASDFQSTYFEPYSKSNDKVFSSEIPEYLLSTLQSASLFLPFNTKANASGVDSYMETTNMLTFESQSGILEMDLSLFPTLSSIQVSTILLDFKTTLLTTTIKFNSKTMPSMIKPSSKQTNGGISYNEIDTSFTDLSFSFRSFSGSLTSNYPVMTSLSSGVFKSIRSFSTNTVQSGLAEKNKNIIFISTISAILTIIVVILLIMFAKVYMSKNNISSPPKTVLPDYSFTGKIIYPLLNTSTTSIKMHPYKHNWNDIV